MHLLSRVILAAALISPFMARGQTNDFPVLLRVMDQVGEGFRNRFMVATREVAAAKLQSLRSLNRNVSIAEFLGPGVERLEVVAFGMPIRDGEEATSGVRTILQAPIVGPGAQEAPTFKGALWSELTMTTLKALVFFKGGAVGRIHCDWQSNTRMTHVVLEDAEGTYWWTRVHFGFSDTGDGASNRTPPQNGVVRGANDARQRE